MTRPNVSRVVALAACNVMLVTAGCSSGTNSTNGATGASGATTTTALRPTTDATLQIVSPAPNERTGGDVRVTMRLGDAHLAPPTQTGGAVRPDEGHIHLSVDGTLVAMPLRLSERLPPLRPGAHTVQAEFVASDHVPFHNRVVAAVTFDVR